MNNNNTHSLADIAAALVRFLPRVPQFLWNNIKLARVNHSDIGSTGYFLQQQAESQPDAAFLYFNDRTYSYREFNEWANQIARTLKNQGVKSGDCVALMFENSPEQLACTFAVNKLGAIAGMINYKQRGDILAYSFNTIQPRLLITGSECIEALVSAEALLEGNMQRYVMTSSRSVECAAGFRDLAEESRGQSTDNLPETKDITLQQQCFYVFTSGTTGLPKAAPMTYLRWYKAGIGFGRMAMGLHSKDIQYCCLPLYHNTALSISLSSVVITGSAMILSPRFSASEFWSDIRKYKATNFVYIGEVCRYLLNSEPDEADRRHGIRAVLGNGLRSEIWDGFQKRFGIRQICELYGASEGNIGFVNAFNLKRTVGFSPMKYAVVSFDVEHERPVENEQGYLQKVKKGDVGLLLAEVSDKAPFDGYTNNAEASQAKLFHDVFKPGDCWFNTGDLVRDQGFRHVAFIDRVGDTFRWKSENVATTEVEAQLQSIQDIEEAVVYGVQVPNTEGRAGMASLILKKGREFDPCDFYQNLKQRLPDYAVPLFLRLREEHHEKTGTFKIKKTQLKKEGFNLQGNISQVFVLIDRARGYQPLDNEILSKIEQGNVRL